MGYSHNQLSQYLQMTFKSLGHITREETNGAEAAAVNPKSPRFCPWALLNKLQNAPEHIDEQVRLQEEQKQRIQQERADYWITAEKNPGEPLSLNLPVMDQNRNCVKCKATWAAMDHTDDDELRGIPIYRCMNCGTEQCIIDQEVTVEIKHYAPCGHCAHPWHNLKQTPALDTKSHRAYTCKVCAQVSLVLRPTGQPQGRRT